MNKKQEVERQLSAVRRGAVQVVSEDELRAKIGRSLDEHEPLRIKLGLDPTSADIHLGNGVPLRKLKTFQELGHQAVLIIGDFTGTVGDPSEQNATRPMLDREDIDRNVKTYIDQAGKIIDVDKLELRYNSEWLAKMHFGDVVRLASKMTVARMLERDYFEKRYRSGTPIGIHEFLYPLMQGWDSAMIDADVEIGGQDQTFNLLIGRDLMRAEGKEPQVCVTLPLLVGLDGVNKMSKSLDNYIGVAEPPDTAYGKAMSIPDRLMRDYFELATELPEDRIGEFLSKDTHPRAAKAALAAEIVRQFWGKKEAEEAAAGFSAKFREDKMPSEMPEHVVPFSSLKDGKVWIVKLLADIGMASSNSDARRKISQGAVTLFRDGKTAEKLDNPDTDVEVLDGMVLKVGKKKEYVRIRLR